MSISEKKARSGRKNLFKIFLFFWLFLFFPGFSSAEECQLRINEVMPAPEGADNTGEWIELKNFGLEEFLLAGWKIQDMKGKTTTYIFKSEKIPASGFLVLFRPVSKITLNNDSDGLRLFAETGALCDQIEYSEAKNGLSYARSGEKWNWTNAVSSGEENIFPSPSIKAMSSLSPQKAEEKNSRINPWRIIFLATAVSLFSGIAMLFACKILDSDDDSLG